eukprot:TRINITY_DN39820_c0_g1_i1.p1 TRINITY_DN39820_c0_g1~~TRINITY_DN39820_c0_g1_i1.p1  ORF type:complete len:348 (-),score=30.66 TRINITY_DN39820_c0_g1_i1:38-1081(-)
MLSSSGRKNIHGSPAFLILGLLACKWQLAFIGVPIEAVYTQSRTLKPSKFLPANFDSRDQYLTRSLRILPAGAVAWPLISPTAADEFASEVWSMFSNASFTQHCMFEACLAVASFTIWIFFFESLHLWLPHAERYRLDRRPPVRALHGFGPEAPDKAFAPALSYLAGIALFHYFGLGQQLFGLKPEFGDPSFARIVVEVVLGVFLYDLLFYPIHFSLHNLPIKEWRRAHARHHSWARKETAAHIASETVYHSLLDGALQVGVNILVQQISPWGFKHPLARAIHNIVVTYLLVETHSGYDLPFMSHRIFPGVFGGSLHHEAHHRNGRVCYHQFFTYIDKSLGLVPPNL